MFGKRFELFRLFGIPIRLDVSWFVIAGLITWSLATGPFPQFAPGLSIGTYWVMALIGTLGLFASIVLHEFFHAWVARRHEIPMEGITLFIFGGVAEMTAEPASPRAEFRMAVAGPLASIAVGAIALGLAGVGPAWPKTLTGVLTYLGVMNLVLAGFNLAPAFPLDGGRILRAALWRWKQDLQWATSVASRFGKAFSGVLMALGVFRMAAGDFLGGMWSFLIGLFLFQAAETAYQQVLVSRVLAGERVSRFMTPNPVTLPSDVTLDDAVDRYFYRHHHSFFPVKDDGRLLGCLSTEELKRVPREEWGRRSVASLVVPCGPDNAIRSDADALGALALMRRTGRPRLLVVDDGRLMGLVTLKDLLEFFVLKVELES